MLGADIDTTEVTITADDILVSHTAISDLDDMLSHFDVRSAFSAAMGHELAKVFDKNVFRSLILAARAAADGPFPGGSAIAVGASPTGKDWIDAIRQASVAMYNKDVPSYEKRYVALPAADFDAIKYATDANGNYLVLNRDFAPSSMGIAGRDESIKIEDVEIFRSRNMPTANETAVSTVYSKYRADFSTTKGIMWTPSAVGTVKLMDISFETQRDVRRLEDFTVAKLLCGHGHLRPECAIEFDVS